MEFRYNFLPPIISFNFFCTSPTTIGTIEIKPLETGNNQRYGEINFTEYSPLGSSTFCDRKQVVEIPPVAGRYDSQLMEFAKCVRGEMENPFTYEYELQTQRMVLAACGQDIDYKAKIEL